MINAQLRDYNYSIYGELNAYGQPSLFATTGSIKMAINIISQTANNNNVLYENASYIGLTNGAINDKYVIDYDGQKLKVLYVNPIGRYKQVYMAVM